MSTLIITEDERFIQITEGLAPERNASTVDIAREIHEDLLRKVMEEPAGPLRVRVRGAGTGLPWRPTNGPVDE